jgi:hypothetical protein
MISKPTKILIGILIGFISISMLHIWLNIGFNKLRIVQTMQNKPQKDNKELRVGFLPVT